MDTTPMAQAFGPLAGPYTSLLCVQPTGNPLDAMPMGYPGEGFCTNELSLHRTSSQYPTITCSNDSNISP